MKLTAMSIANAAGLSGAILWVGCVLIAWLLPDLYAAGTKLLALTGVGHVTVDISTVVLGGILFTAISWVSGYVFGWSLRMTQSRRK